MAVIHEVQPVKPVCAVLVSRDIILDEALNALEQSFGSIDEKSVPYDFDFTSYYKKEMGEELKKIFVSFTLPAEPLFLPDMKITANRLEKTWSLSGRRRINVDPGYIALSKLVVASAKEFAHRIYIGKGIYADLQLQYRHEKFWPHPWTFPDYQTPEALAFFKKVRDEFYKKAFL